MKKLPAFSVFLLFAVLVFGFVGCPSGTDDGSGEEIPEVYIGFYNYPAGRVNANGLLTIQNTANLQALLFIDSVEGVNYIGTVGANGSVSVTLPEEKFYTILAVDKESYEQSIDRAFRYSVLVYYSNANSYSVIVTPSSGSGYGNWVMNNNSSYWVQVKSSSLNFTYAVLPPYEQNIVTPVYLYEVYEFIPIFTKELKYDGRVITLLEISAPEQSNSISVSSAMPNYTSNFNDPSAARINIPPMVLLVNGTGYTVGVYYESTQLTNGNLGGVFTVPAEGKELISSFNIGDNTNKINFYATQWQTNKWVSEDISMEVNKVYQITLDPEGNSMVTEIDATDFFE